MKKQKVKKPLFRLALGKKKVVITKTSLEWFVLTALVLLVLTAYFSGLYSYVYGYAKCDDTPLEVRGSYFRLPYDENYGIHAGSDYSHCSGERPTGLERDPSTKAGAQLLEASRKEKDFSHGAVGFTVYTPEAYEITHFYKSGSENDVQVSYFVTLNNTRYRVRVMKKDSTYSYTNLCSQPPTEKWSGEIIGMDATGHKICRIVSTYIDEYVVGINIGNSAIMLHTPIDKSEALLNSDARVLFDAMVPYKN